MIMIAWLVLASLALFCSLAFGWRSWLQWRRTGSTGYRGISGCVGSAEWFGGVALVIAMVLAAAAPLCVVLGWVAPAPLVPVLVAVGALVLVAGIAATLGAQLSMGTSWRIGVDETERTALVTHGPFQWSRNPIFGSMLVALFGEALLLPTPLSLAAFAVALFGIELQVRFVEEPYLLRTHGDAYARYAARVGRFLPVIGRLRVPQRG